eukprot:1161962-Pelagomonas_calceolata.AAC.1
MLTRPGLLMCDTLHHEPGAQKMHRQRRENGKTAGVHRRCSAAGSLHPSADHCPVGPPAAVCALGIRAQGEWGECVYTATESITYESVLRRLYFGVSAQGEWVRMYFATGSMYLRRVSVYRTYTYSLRTLTKDH